MNLFKFIICHITGLSLQLNADSLYTVHNIGPLAKTCTLRAAMRRDLLLSDIIVIIFFKVRDYLRFGDPNEDGLKRSFRYYHIDEYLVCK